ncbi:hypothetical protein ElyMa_006395000 [Elysia marginata]|uniref:Uncharacterized protein n=1 Tax=Elysia marginata TaxID=1093978 RepID=A0AAV4HQ38_9GAST|nr:hypothetical protein ElyMa_006395000 [Elysia marginata]
MIECGHIPSISTPDIFPQPAHRNLSGISVNDRIWPNPLNLNSRHLLQPAHRNLSGISIYDRIPSISTPGIFPQPAHRNLSGISVYDRNPSVSTPGIFPQPAYRNLSGISIYDRMWPNPLNLNSRHLSLTST